jgi:hypothetical protein
MIDQILRMVDQELEDFENDKNRRTGLKSLVEFTSTNIEYNGDESNFEIKPKFKQKLKVSVYIKETKDKRSLF